DVVIVNRAEPRLYHEILMTGKLIFEKNRECRIRHEVRNRRLYEDYRRLHAIYMKGVKARHG
ncbi:MAG TPA: nucleotidyltransferase domain-containing protein, partial [Spirochaetota bacterium]|nr:nucleotidyltransferase domain-containing protein [Spirochaetota bacterium]